MISFKVREEYSQLKDFTLSLPDTFNHIGSIIQDNRNIIKKVETSFGTFVVKNFKGMYFFNKLGYSLFRKSKAERAYLYSALLNENNIITPPHVAWLDCYTWGLLTKSYFVSEYFPYKTLKEVLNSEIDGSYKSSLYHHLAAFTIKLHSAGIYHKDYSLGNILIIPTDKGFDFALVDLNRVLFSRKISFRKGLRNFTTLGISPEDMNMLISEYAKLSGQSPDAALAIFQKEKKRESDMRKLRRSIKRYTVTPLEKIFTNCL